MQVLKDEIREKIRLSAIEEFKKNGYGKASMRAIASQAGISVGNLYRYFENKHSLFSFIVQPVVDHLKELEIHYQYHCNSMKMNTMDYLDLIIGSMVKARKGRKDELYILLEKSQGSSYEKMKQNFSDGFEKYFIMNILPQVSKDRKIIRGELFSKALAVCAVEGTCIMLRESKNEKEFIENMIQFIEIPLKSLLRTLFGIEVHTKPF